MLDQIFKFYNVTIGCFSILWQSFLLASILAVTFYVLRWFRNPYLVYRLQPSPNLHSQSTIIDEEKNIRASPEEWVHDLSTKLQTVRDIIEYNLEEKQDKPCFGLRENFNGPTVWTTYAQVQKNIQALGSQLNHLVPTTKEKERFVGIYGRNSPEWVCTQMACGYYGLVAVPMYETLGVQALKHIVQQTNLQVVVCDTVERARNFLDWAQGKVEHLIIMKPDKGDMAQLRTDCLNVLPYLHDYNELLTRGLRHSTSTEQLNPDDLFLLCYTSGSTGLPKGVMYSHRSFIHALLMADSLVDKTKLSETEQLHLSYLPLSHIMEQLVMVTSLLRGISVAFLTTDMSGMIKDLRHYRPTIFCAVPRILSRIYTDVMKTIDHSRVKKALLDYAIRQKLEEQANGIYKKSGLLDRVYFRNIRAQFGGRVEQLVCGSAPLQPEVLQFIKAALSCPVYEGYGSTEAGGLVSVTLPTDQTVSHAGSLVCGVKVKLANVPTMGLVSLRDGTGEICVMSGACTSGYYKDSENTMALFDEDGFLRTGDIGSWNENGSLKIVDRCKSIFKLSQGEYVAPEKVEQIYSSSSLVLNVFLDGHSASSFAVAVVVPDCKEVWRRFGGQLAMEFGEDKIGLPDGYSPHPSDKELCEKPVVRKLILDKLTKLGHQAGLKGFEQAKAIHLCPEPFTIANGLLTPTLKVARVNVRKHFGTIIDDLYKNYHL